MLPPLSLRPSSAMGHNLHKVAEAEFLAGKQAVCPRCCREIEGIALHAVFSSSNALRLPVAIFSTLDSQTDRPWASGSTQQRGDYHTNPCKHSISGMCPSGHSLSFCTLWHPAGHDRHPCIFLPVPLLLPGPGKNLLL